MVFMRFVLAVVLSASVIEADVGLCVDGGCQPAQLYGTKAAFEADWLRPVTLTGLSVVQPPVMVSLSDEMRELLAEDWDQPRPWTSNAGIVWLNWLEDAPSCPDGALKSLSLTCAQAQGLVFVRRGPEGILGYGDFESKRYKMTAEAIMYNLSGLLGTPVPSDNVNEFPPSNPRGPTVQPVVRIDDFAIVWAWMPRTNGAFPADHPYLTYAVRVKETADETAREGTDGNRWSTALAPTELEKRGIKIAPGAWAWSPAARNQ